MTSSELCRTWHTPALVVACLAGLGLCWWLADALLLTPAVPGPAASPQAVFDFVSSTHGLPRLNADARTAFLESQFRRAVADPAFCEYLAATLRQASADDQAAFRTHLFDALKPLLLADVHAFEAAAAEHRISILDERIVAYNRMAAFLKTAEIRRETGAALGQTHDWLPLLLSRTSPAERDACLRYGQALAGRVQQILAEPQLMQEMQARIERKPG